MGQSMDPVLKIVENEHHDIEGHDIRVKKVGPKDWSRDSKFGNSNNMNLGMGQWNPAAFGAMGMIDPRAMAMTADPRAMGMTADPRAMAMNADPRALAMSGFGGMASRS